MPKSIKDSELKAVIAALESDMNAAFEVSKAGLLAKADDEASKKDGPPSESSDDSATPPASSSPASDAGGPPPAASADPAGPDAAATASPDASGAAAPAPGADGAMDPAAAQAPLTPEALQAEYAQLAPEELDMHIKAALSAKEALAAASAPAPDASAAPAASPAPAGSPAGGPPAGSPPPGAGSPPPGMDPMMGKGEMKADMAPAGTPATHAKASGGQMTKSESDPAVEALKAELAEMKKSLADKTEDVENLTKAVKMVLERPERKAVTGISYLGKAEAAAPEVKKTFTPAEAKAKIAELIPTLTKSERELVSKATVSGKFEQIAPILEKYVK